MQDINKTQLLEEKLFGYDDEPEFENIIDLKLFTDFSDVFFNLLQNKSITKKDVVNLIFESPFNKSKKDSIRKKVFNWYNNKNKPDRDSAYQLCILLKLNLDESVEFFNKALGYKWTHFRNCSDIIYHFCIQNNLSIKTAKELIGEYYSYRADELKLYTQQIKNEFDNLQENTNENNRIEKFKEFLFLNREYFGCTRNTLHQNFIDIIKLKNEFVKRNGKIDTYTLAQVLSDTIYEYKNEDDLKRDKSLRMQLDKYISRQSEVPRNIFIRCALISGVDDVCTLNGLLLECGFNELYPRNSFDAWIYDALIHCEAGNAYYRLCDTYDIFERYING